MKITCLLILFVSLVSVAFSLSKYHNYGGGTSIIVIVDVDSAWIVADSRHTITNSTGKTTYTSVCKIGITKNIFYTFSGNHISDELDDGYKMFDTYDLMKKEIEKGNSFDSAFAQFEQKIMTRLAAYCREDSLENPQLFMKNITPNVLLQVFAVTFINNKSVFRIREYYNKGQSKGKIEIAWDNSSEKKVFPIIAFLGKREAIFNFLDSNKEYKVDVADIRIWGQYLIGLEAKANPDIVDTSVNIISVGNNGEYRWILRNQSCK